jgi:opacity protein-like surface antigen
MVACHRSIIAGAVDLVTSPAGAAADDYQGAIETPPPIMQPARWYLRGDTNYDWMDAGDLRGAFANDFRPYDRFTPYLGVGLGGAYHNASGGAIVSCGGTCPYDGGTSWSAAAAVMAGFSLRLDCGAATAVSSKDAPVYEPGRLHLDVGYRFLYLGDAHTGNLTAAAVPTPGPRLDDVMAHEIRLGLRWDTH